MLVIGNLIILNNNLSFFAPYVLIAHFEFVAPFLNFVPYDIVIYVYVDLTRQNSEDSYLLIAKKLCCNLLVY